MKVVRVLVGMNAINCPVCKRGSRDTGTLFIPVTMDTLAKLRCGHTQTVSVKGSCSHVVEVKIRSTGMAV